MSISRLTDIRVPSPNHSGKRTMSVDRITPHCAVAQCSAERLGEIFANPSKQASANYGIGYDGKVVCCVDEDNRSWCSSSPANDQRAITIECASESFEPYAMNDVVFEKLVDLCVDICENYGKRSLIWIPNKDKALAYKPSASEMLITVHRWFANKSCPGDWLYNRLYLLADRVTEKLIENLNEYKENIYPLTPFKVMVNVPDLNIRKDCSTGSESLGFTGSGIFTIVETKTDNNGETWGKLKSGAGWIYLGSPILVKIGEHISDETPKSNLLKAWETVKEFIESKLTEV